MKEATKKYQVRIFYGDSPAPVTIPDFRNNHDAACFIGREMARADVRNYVISEQESESQQED